MGALIIKLAYPSIILLPFVLFVNVVKLNDPVNPMLRGFLLLVITIEYVFPTSSLVIFNKTCRTCNESLKVCYSCYSGYYLYALNGTCVTDCPSASTYRTYAGNTSCDPCTNNCSTCLSLTQCLTCIQGFYLH